MTLPSAPILHGDPLSVRLTGLRPRGMVAVTASGPTGWGRPRVQTARATFRADACATVNATGDAPLDGTWSGSDPRALFWSMMAADAAPAAGWTASEVRIAADTDADGAPDLAASIRFADASRPEVLLGDAFPGAFFMTPPNDSPHPGIILMGGSEGGDGSVRARAPQFTARGYAVVGLPCYAPSYGGPSRFPTLPAAFWNIPVDRMEGVLGWLRARADVDGTRIGMFGVSKGAEFALAAASRMSGFAAVAAVAAVVPTDVTWEGWGPGTSTGRSSGFSCAAPRSRSCRTRAWTPRSPSFRTASPGTCAARTTRARRVRRPDRARAHRGGGDRGPRARRGRRPGPGMEFGGDGGRDRRDPPRGGPADGGAVFPDAGHSLSGDGIAPDAPADARAQSVVYAATLAFFERHLRPARSPAPGRVEP